MKELKGAIIVLAVVGASCTVWGTEQNMPRLGYFGVGLLAAVIIAAVCITIVEEERRKQKQQ